MTVFWAVAALFLIGALLILLPGLLRPPVPATDSAGANLALHRDALREAARDLEAGTLDAADLAQTRAEIHQRVLADAALPAAAAPEAAPARRTAWALALLIPLGSVGTYLQLGDPQAVVPALPSAPSDRHGVTPAQIQQMVAALGERLKAQPDDAEGWMMLGRSYTALGRYRDAVAALRRALLLVPDNPSLLADLADVVGMANNKRLAGEPATLVQRALDLDPRHVKALALAGSVSFEARDFDGAVAHWNRLLAVLPPGSPMARSVQGSIAEATQRAQGDALPAAGTVLAAASARGAAPAATPAAAAAGPAVSGQVVVSAELAQRIAPGDTLFVFARAAQGPRMPLAILRLPAGTGAVDFRLDDSLAMSPELKLSGFAQVVVGARISRSGNATPQRGDLIGQGTPVAPGAQGLRIVIDREQP